MELLIILEKGEQQVIKERIHKFSNKEKIIGCKNVKLNIGIAMMVMI